MWLLSDMIGARASAARGTCPRPQRQKDKAYPAATNPMPGNARLHGARNVHADGHLAKWAHLNTENSHDGLDLTWATVNGSGDRAEGRRRGNA